MRPFAQMLLKTSFLFLVSCKTVHNSSQVAAAGSEEQGGALCCSFSHSKGIYFDTVTCNGSDPQSCCERGRLPVLLTQKRYLSHMWGACDALAAQYRSRVEICRGPTRFGEESPVVGGASDYVSGFSKLAHVWIKTPMKEVGMGPLVSASDNNSETLTESMRDFLTAKTIREKINVSWRDHDGFSQHPGAKCEALSFCDEQCVNDATVFGTPLGIYSLVNQCHLAAVKVLRKCGCYNHCIAYAPGTSLCVKRIFPELRGFNLDEPAPESTLDL